MRPGSGIPGTPGLPGAPGTASPSGSHGSPGTSGPQDFLEVTSTVWNSESKHTETLKLKHK